MGVNSKSRRILGHVGVQLTIRDQLNLDPTDLIKIAMHEALRECPLSRSQVVDDMNRKEIKKWMIDTGITQAQIAREARVSKALVSMILKGERTNKTRRQGSRVQLVITLLKWHGCPEEFLVSLKSSKAA